MSRVLELLAVEIRLNDPRTVSISVHSGSIRVDGFDSRLLLLRDDPGDSGRRDHDDSGRSREVALARQRSPAAHDPADR